MVDWRVIVKETEQVVERSTQLRCHDTVFRTMFAILAPWQNMFFQNGEPFARHPYDMMIQLKRRGVSCDIEFP